MKSQTRSTNFALAAGALLLIATNCDAQRPVAANATAPPIPAAQPAQNPTPSGDSSATAETPGDQAKPNPVLTVRDDKVLEAFEPPVDAEYTLGAGDEITLDFGTQTDLDLKTTVGPDGRITLKYAGPVHIADLTREAAGAAIKEALSKYYTDLSVTVSIDKYSANRVRVTGYVQHPGEILFDGTPTLLDAIGKAGLISPTVTKDGATANIGPGVPETCTIYRANNTAVPVQLRKLLEEGSIYADLRLRRNDIVYVPQPKEEFVSVLGQVAHPGTVPLTPQSTLTSVLAQSGCCTDNAGFNPKIHILQPSTGKDFAVNYKDVMNLNGQKEFALHSGDVVIVPTSSLSKFTIVFQKISPVATILSLAAITGVL